MLLDTRPGEAYTDGDGRQYYDTTDGRSFRTGPDGRGLWQFVQRGPSAEWVQVRGETQWQAKSCQQFRAAALRELEVGPDEDDPRGPRFELTTEIGWIAARAFFRERILESLSVWDEPANLFALDYDDYFEATLLHGALYDNPSFDPDVLLISAADHDEAARVFADVLAEVRFQRAE